ncbi:hypothetical protein [Escherichia coli]|uniref:hypothetical protein n=1 Tax=Escherichia coli TaxID=562 RepID=UPI0020204A12|nr:hypothetical protein [Escherichia coli]
MANERITEGIVRDVLRDYGYYLPGNGISVEEQKSEIQSVKSLLSKAGKAAKGGAGYPEFIISTQTDTQFIIIFECKSDVRKHVSSDRNRPVEFAVDGVLHYAKFLSEKYTVIAVAVSGITKEQLKISTFLFAAGADEGKRLLLNLVCR